MKKFTVKDFITYNNPCFSCGNKISFRIGSIATVSASDVIYLRPNVTLDRTEVDLKISYTQTLQLWTFHKSNKILSSDIEGLTNYLTDHKLVLNSRCDHCYTTIESFPLEFNLPKGFIKPVGVNKEMLIVSDDMNMYQIHSYFPEEKSFVAIDRINKTTPVSPMRLELPLLPLYKFKDKEHFINKIKTYLIFS